MNCNEAEKYMMKYLDSELSKEEAGKLNGHMLDCAACKESFFLYEQMQSAFSPIFLMEAPECFEQEVMARIVSISDHEFEVSYSLKSRVWGTIWGTFTVLFGTGTVIAFYRMPIMESLAQNSYFAERIAHLLPVANEMTQHSETIKLMAGETVAAANTILTNAMGILFAALTILCGVQFYILQRRKKTNKVEHK